MSDYNDASSGGYDFSHLLDSTRHVGVEEAAVRETESDEEAHENPNPAQSAQQPGVAPPITPTAQPTPRPRGPIKFCEMCGNARGEGDIFCQKCGARFRDTVRPNQAGAPGPGEAATTPDIAPVVGDSLSTTRIYAPDEGMETPGHHAPPAPVAPLPPITPPAPVVPLPPITPPVPVAGPEPVSPSEPSVQAGSPLITSVPGAHLAPPTSTHPQPAAPSPVEETPAPVGTLATDNPPPLVTDEPQVAATDDIALSATAMGIGDQTITPGQNQPSTEGAGTDDGDDEDEDAATISIAALRAARAEEKVKSDRPTVQAVHCPSSHPNPPHFDSCRTCGAEITDHSVTVITRPPLGTLTFDDGRVEVLDAPLVVGRKPRVDQTIGSEPARAVALDDPDRLLSRVHAEIRLSDWQVQVIDRESMNHTFVQIPGQTMLQLRPGEPFSIPPGTRITFGEVTSCQLTLEVK